MISAFDFDRGNDRGVLCIHGFTGSPFEVRPLGERLAERGFTAVGPLLPGHGSDAAALNATSWRDWLAAVETALADLRRRCRVVGVAGLSMGGALALRVAARNPDLRALAVLGTPLWLPFHITAAVLALRSVHQIPKGPSDIRDAAVRAAFPSARHFPLHALRSLLEFLPRARAAVPRVRTPTLIIHADHDHVAPPACAVELHARVGAGDKKLVRLARSFHIVTVDVERELVADEVERFFTERMS